MILGDPSTQQPQDGEETLDAIFRRNVARRPDALALSDSPHRSAIASGPVRRLSYGQADRAINALAWRISRLGLQRDSVIGLFLPNTVEGVISLLAVWRAGMIAAPLPLLWRRKDLVQALQLVGAKAIVTHSQVDGVGLAELAMRTAAELFPIRFVCGFGSGLPDGIIPLDAVFTEDAALKEAHLPASDAAQHVAVVTFDVTAEGLVAVARSHAQLVAGGLATILEGGLEPEAVLLGCHATSSFAGLAATVLPWLLVGGTLSLHHGFDAAAFEAQCQEDRCDSVAVPGPMAARLAAAGLFARRELRSILAVWRTPERLSSAASWTHIGAALVDLLAFGEIAALGLRRGVDGRPSALPGGDLRVPRGSGQAVWVAEIARTHVGTMALRGPMVPRHPFPPAAARLSLPHLRANAEGFVDTGYACRFDAATNTIQVTAPPPGMVSVGGYRFLLRDLASLSRQLGHGATLTALPDALTGHRLAGTADDTVSVRAALTALGLNPLVTDAFCEPKAA